GQEGHQRCDHRAQVRLRPALAGEQEGDRRDRERRGHPPDHLDAGPTTTDTLNTATSAPNSAARARSPQVGCRTRQMPTVRTTWPRIVTEAPKRGRLSTIFQIPR